MKIGFYNEIENKTVDIEGAVGVKIRWLIGHSDKNAPFHMRYFEVEPLGNTPLHTHNGEHEVYILEGNGVLNNGEKTFPLKSGSFVLVEKGEKHQFKNLSDKEYLKFLCIIPVESSR
jgi:quercetin dioxygenase-like cupin family protein